jgi:hypothetical protein
MEADELGAHAPRHARAKFANGKGQMGIHQADLDAGMAELVKDLKHYKQQTTVAYQHRRRFWMLVGSMIMVAVGIWLR